MDETLLKDYQDYIKARLRRINAHVDSLDTESNLVTCSCINTILDDVKRVISCLELKEKHINNK